MLSSVVQTLEGEGRVPVFLNDNTCLHSKKAHGKAISCCSPPFLLVWSISATKESLHIGDHFSLDKALFFSNVYFHVACIWKIFVFYLMTNKQLYNQSLKKYLSGQGDEMMFQQARVLLSKHEDLCWTSHTCKSRKWPGGCNFCLGEGGSWDRGIPELLGQSA